MEYFAAIDIGSNSIHMIIAKVLESGQVIIMDSYKTQPQLVSKLGADFSFSETLIDEVVSYIQKLNEIAFGYKAKILAVATYALRIATNADVLIAKIGQKTGIKVSIIEGKEEARLAALGVRAGLYLSEKVFFGVDIGGGSSELFLAKGVKLLAASSLALGALDLRKYLDLNHLGEIKRADFSRFNDVLTKSIDSIGNAFSSFFEVSVVYSGSIKDFANIDSQDQGFGKLSSVNFYSLGVERIHVILDKIFEMEKIKKIEDKWGIEPGKVVPIVTSLLILDKISKKMAIRRWLVSSYGLREALLIEHVKKTELPFALDYESSLKKAQTDFQIDCFFAQKLSSYALKILRSLLPLIQESYHLEEEDSVFLHFAASLHECGKLLNNLRYHRHSHYLISNYDFPCFSQKQRQVIALIARFGKKGEVIYGSEDCRGFHEREIVKINLLAKILRVARALCLSRQYKVDDIEILKHRPSEFVFRLYASDQIPASDLEGVLMELGVLAKQIDYDFVLEKEVR